jgi:restriction system protein
LVFGRLVIGKPGGCESARRAFCFIRNFDAEDELFYTDYVEVEDSVKCDYGRPREHSIKRWELRAPHAYGKCRSNPELGSLTPNWHLKVDMEAQTREELRQKIDDLSLNWHKLDAQARGDRALDIIVDLAVHDLSLQNVVITQIGSSPDALVRLDGSKRSIGVKIIGIPTGDETLGSVINRAYGSGFFERLIVFNSTGFSADTVRAVNQLEPAQVELVDFPRLAAWADSGQDGVDPELNSIQIAINDFARQIARLVAQDSKALASLEWRDVERMLAEACSGMGFQVELTPPAKDGGRDIVLHCWIFGHRRKYFVEVKHWATRVGHDVVQNFLRVVVEDHADKGLILATTGYTKNAFEQLTQIEQRRVRGADREKIIAICQLYVRARSGLYIPSAELPELLFDGSLPVV